MEQENKNADQLFSEDQWMVHCLSLSAIAALAVMQIAPLVA